MSRKRGWQNLTSARRKLRRITKVTGANPFKIALGKVATATALDAAQLAPKDEGDLAQSIEFKLSGDGLAVVVGPSAKNALVRSAANGSLFSTRRLTTASNISKEKLFNFYKGYWAEFGTKGGLQQVRVDGVSYTREIAAQPARPFMQPAFDLNVAFARAEMAKAMRQQINTVIASGRI